MGRDRPWIERSGAGGPRRWGLVFDVRGWIGDGLVRLRTAVSTGGCKRIRYAYLVVSYWSLSSRCCRKTDS